MAYSKIILNGETLMDVTSDTVAAGSLLSGKTATKNDGTKVTGNIASKTASDLTASGATVTAAAGYYPSAVSKAVTTTTHPNPTAAIASSTGVVTATHTQTTGYVTSGTTTGTLNLTTQGATTYNTSTADQTVASYRWLTGTQTIKSVTTTNLTAANIASGVVVKVGDANNASRITQVTGTYAPAVSSVTVTPTETTQTFNATGVYGYKPVTVNGISSTYVGTGIARKSSTDVAFASATATFTAPIGYYSASATKTLTTQAAQTIYPSTADQTVASYRWLTGNQTFKSVTTTNLTAANIVSGTVVKVGDSANASRITQVTGTYSGIIPTGTLTISSAGTHNVYNYASASVKAGAATTPATTISPGIDAVADTSGIIHITASGSSSITPTVTSGYVTGGTAGTVTVNGGAAVPATALDSNLVAGNIAEGVSIFGVEGTHSGGGYTCTITSSSGSMYDTYVTFNGTHYYTTGDSFTFNGGETLVCHMGGRANITGDIYINGVEVSSDVATYNYILPSTNIELSIYVGSSGTIYIYESIIPKETLSITSNASYNVYGYSAVDVNVQGGGFTIDQIAIRAISGNISGSTTFIYNFAFYNCTALTTVSFPSVTTIGGHAFDGCRYLTTANFPSATSIGTYAFYSCRSLMTIDFPKVTRIYDFVFYNCTALTIVNFPTATWIGSNAFCYCGNLTTASFPSVTTIGSNAFQNCYSLTSVSFPLVISINNSAFYNCSHIMTADFPNATNIGSSAFRNCSRITTANFPNATSIGTSAFYSCTALTTVSFPEVISIYNFAFSSCTALTIVNFPTATWIGPGAFSYCTALTTASFPIAKNISNYAFQNCYNLISLYLNSVSAIPTLGTSPFGSTPISDYSTSAGRYGSIFVPSSLYTAFTTATGWTAYSARMVSV